MTVEYCERVSGSETRWIQKTALMMSFTRIRCEER